MTPYALKTIKNINAWLKKLSDPPLHMTAVSAFRHVSISSGQCDV